MITINENNITVDFLKSDLVHIALEQEAHFSTQLMRELRAISKINNGETVKNCIISNHKDFGKEADWCRICKKADHMKEFMTVAGLQQFLCCFQFKRKRRNNRNRFTESLP